MHIIPGVRRPHQSGPHSCCLPGTIWNVHPGSRPTPGQTPAHLGTWGSDSSDQAVFMGES